MGYIDLLGLRVFNEAESVFFRFKASCRCHVYHVKKKLKTLVLRYF